MKNKKIVKILTFVSVIVCLVALLFVLNVTRARKMHRLYANYADRLSELDYVVVTTFPERYIDVNYECIRERDPWRNTLVEDEDLFAYEWEFIPQIHSASICPQAWYIALLMLSAKEVEVGEYDRRPEYTWDSWNQLFTYKRGGMSVELVYKDGTSVCFVRVSGPAVFYELGKNDVFYEMPKALERRIKGATFDTKNDFLKNTGYIMRSCKAFFSRISWSEFKSEFNAE